MIKKIFSKLPLIGLLALICGVYVGCKPIEQTDTFSVELAEVGPGYVDIHVTASKEVEIAYLVDTKEQLMNNPDVMFVSGVTKKVQPDETFRISDNLQENTQYYLYVVAKLDAQSFSDIFTLPFKTTEYELNELLTVVDRSLDGFKMRITLPDETKERGNAIRFAHSCLLQYNYSRSSGNGDDYFNLLYNGGRFTDVDITAEYNEDLNWYLTGQDADGDGAEDWANYWNSISPGEPIVYIAGEFAWMDESMDDMEQEGVFGYPSGWPSGYYMPMIDESYYTEGGAGSDNEQSAMGVITDWNLDHPLDEYWTGAFQRKIFHSKDPEPLDAGVTIEVAELTPVEAVINFIPDEGVHQYCVGIFDSATYNELCKLLTIDGTLHDEYFQWAVTAYFSAYVFGTFAGQGEMAVQLSDMFYVTNLPAEDTFHVLVTAMGDASGFTQSFQEATFQLKPKVLPEPKVSVTPDPENSTPYLAAFNIRCEDYENVPVTMAYYAANYVRDWKLALNAGSTYQSLILSNSALGRLSEDELADVNSASGLTIKIPTIDGETTRLAVLGYNEELTPNSIDKYEFIEDCPAVADLTTEYAPMKDWVNPKHYDDLVGEWTISATLQNGSDENDTFAYSSKVNIAADLFDYPETLPQNVYDIYKKAGKDKEVVDALYTEFKELAEKVTEERLENQNRLVCIGWLDKAQYGRLDARTPYDLFVAENYSSIDVSSIYNDYGPKWYIETVENADGSISYKVPFDDYLLPPTSNWSVPFYLSAMEIDDYYTIMHAEIEEGVDPYESMLSFPVEISEDRNTITIKPFVYEKTTYYPNVIGLDPMYGSLLDYPVISDVVLTRGKTNAAATKCSVSAPAGKVTLKGEFPKHVYKSITPFDAAPVKVVKKQHVTIEKVRENADRYFDNLKSISDR